MAMYRVADLDVLSWQGPVIDRDLSSPPGSPTKGDRYIVKATGASDWAGHDNAITYYTGTAWVFIAPIEGLVCWVKDEDLFVRHNGTIWDVLVPAGGGLGITMNFFATTSPMTPSSYHFFGGQAFTLTQLDGAQRVYVAKPGTIKVAYITLFAATVVGSGENISVYIRKNATTDYLIQTVGNTNQLRVFSNTGLSISVVQGDYIEIKIVTPAWATTPTGNRWSGIVYIE